MLLDYLTKIYDNIRILYDFVRLLKKVSDYLSDCQKKFLTVLTLTEALPPGQGGGGRPAKPPSIDEDLRFLVRSPCLRLCF